MKQIGKRVYNNNFFKYWGDTVPLKNNLLFFSKNRVGSTVVNKIDDNKNGELVYNPLTDVIDIQDETKYPRGETTTGSGDTLHVWENVTLLTKLDDVIGNKTFKIVKDFDDFQAVDNGRSETDYYIMSRDIDCSASQTMNRTRTDLEVGSMLAWISGTYTDGQIVKVKNDEGAYPIDTPLATTRYDIYRRTLYTTGYKPSDEPITNPGYNGDSETYDDIDIDGFSQKKYADDLRYWHIYNYEGFWIDEFKGVFSGNGFELQNCYVNKVTQNTGVFSQLTGGKLSNIGVTGSVIGYDKNAGGLVGFNYSSAIITNSYSACSVVGYSSSVGGLVGNNSYGKIRNSYSTGRVTGYGAMVGGLVGLNNNSSITNSYSACSVVGYSSSVGGLVGLNNSSIANCYYSSLSGQTDIGKGLLVPDADMKGIDNIATYVEWDFPNTWAINDGYPYLRMQVDNLANPISNSRIVNNYDGYIMMPSDIEIESGKPLFNRDDTDIYNEDATSVETGYVGDGTGGESSYYWHISELNTATILSYMNNDYKNSWFVKNTFDGSEVKTIKEILAYNAPTTDAEDLAKIMKYLGIGE